MSIEKEIEKIVCKECCNQNIAYTGCTCSELRKLQALFDKELKDFADEIRAGLKLRFVSVDTLGAIIDELDQALKKRGLK